MTRQRVTEHLLHRLADRLRPPASPVGRLLILFPGLWPEADLELFHAPRNHDELGMLVERRTGAHPAFVLRPFWAIAVPVPEELLVLNDEEKSAFLKRHETRPQPWWQRRGRRCYC